MFRILNKDLLEFGELVRKRLESERMFSLMNNENRVGNYTSLVSNFLSFSALADSQPSGNSLHALYVPDRMAVTRLVKIAIGL
jgi:hypothetical protein